MFIILLKHSKEYFFKGIKLHRKKNTENKLHTKNVKIFFLIILGRAGPFYLPLTPFYLGT
jgi:hypothetical protein